MGVHSQTRRHGSSATTTDADAFFLEHGWTRVPRLVQWMTTLRCPLSCEHCLAADDNGEDMAAAHAAHLIEQVAALGVEEFLMTGGEPLARPDLPEIISMLRANGVRWTLNTAIMPNRRFRKAIEQWPPGFVAVSIDGPEKVHDAFRRRAGAFRLALASIGYFTGLAPNGVAAGTTVTTKNHRHLAATFCIILESGAAQWGLHLLVPEGRAARRPDLFLSRRQLRELLRFAASRRSQFPVVMADEIGYCGAWEPLVRGEPFFCGAGKAQCVVLPDGELVPCTTLDRSASAGNVIRQPLREIWETGFAELRRWRPQGKCRSCCYAVACEGGCWLQRRHGTECFRHVWRVPAPAMAAGLAVCIGLVASGQALAAEVSASTAPAAQITDLEAAKMQILQSSIVQWYASQFRGHRAPDFTQVRLRLRMALPDDPGAEYFLRFADGRRPAKIEDCAKEIEKALQTKQRSLCLIGLAWRDVTEWCLAGQPPQRRTEAERKALRDITVKLGETAETWRTEIFRDKLDPFLRRPVGYRRFFLTKAGPRAYDCMSIRLAEKRWGGGPDIAEQFVAEHPYAETMDLRFRVRVGTGLYRARNGKTTGFDGTLRLFDLLIVPKQEADKPVVLTSLSGNQELEVLLPPDSELTYGDVLRLVHEQNTKAFEGQALDTFLRTANMHRLSPLALPELLKRKREFEMNQHDPEPATFPLLFLLVDLYLF